MSKIKLILGIAALLFSSVSNAVIITHGNLISDDSTNIIKDVVAGREYLRFYTFHLSYTDTLSAVSVGGIYEGWTMANEAVADGFMSALLGGAALSCGGSSSFVFSVCGTVPDWIDGDFGQSKDTSYDGFTYTIDGSTDFIGQVVIDPALQVGKYIAFTSTSPLERIEFYSNLNFLLTREASPVPEPSILVLLSLGLIGMGVVRKRSIH